MNDPIKTAVVTGAGKRLGKAIVEDLAVHGWRVVIHYNSSGDAAAELARDINKRHKKNDPVAFCVGGDLRREDETQQLLGKAADVAGPVTCLINNASTFEPDEVHNVTRASWDLHLEVNLRAPMVLSQNFAAQLPAKSQGNVINIIDQRVWRLTPKFLSYTVSKAALWTLTQTLAQALAPTIRVNAIGPGPTLQNIRQSADDFKRQASFVPLERATEPSEICDAVRFILGAPAMTGQMIALDGGQHLAWQTPDVTQAGE